LLIFVDVFFRVPVRLRIIKQAKDPLPPKNSQSMAKAVGESAFFKFVKMKNYLG